MQEKQAPIPQLSQQTCTSLEMNAFQKYMQPFNHYSDADLHISYQVLNPKHTVTPLQMDIK